MSDEETAARDLRLAVGHLGAGKPGQAIPLLERVETSLAASTDLEDIHARTLSLLAQALLEQGRVPEARARAHAALRILKGLDDGEGLAEVRALDARIARELTDAKRASLARESASVLASRTADAVEADANSPLAAADAMLRHCAALRTMGRDDEAYGSASRAILHADAVGSIREQVLGRIALAESRPADAHGPLHEALALADRADETTLIGLIAKAAELADVPLPKQHGPLDRGPERKIR